MKTGRQAHHVTPWELSGVPVADNGDLLAVDRHMVVVNDPAAIVPASATRSPITRRHQLPIRPSDAQARRYQHLSSEQGSERERGNKRLCSLDVSVECSQGGVILEQVRCLLHAAYTQPQPSSHGVLGAQSFFQHQVNSGNIYPDSRGARAHRSH